MGRWIRGALWTALGVVGLAALAIAWAASGRGDGAAVLDVTPVSRGEGRALAADGRLRVGTYNIAYGRGEGDDVSGPWPAETFTRNLAGIAERLREWDLDVVALQEVDLDAARSYGTDQARALAERADYPYYACVITWQNRYVPYPFWPPARHYGRMRSGQCVLSRFPIAANTRFRLPQPADNPVWYNWFYLHRAIQHVRLDLGADRSLDVFNVHLEAYGTDNRREQARRLVALAAERAGEHALLLGDLNALPTEATQRHGFTDEPHMDFRGDDTLEIVSKLGWSEALDGVPEADTFTFPAPTATRRLDYLFAKGLRLGEGRVARDAGGLSDHLPVVATAILAR